ncbi:MAG: hypothetical protein KF894_11865 [Labilithrix sp.]|nr:hypothetical protein [Labilithrix sp.]
MRSCVCILTAIALGGCAPRRDDVTPTIEISPGAKGRIMWMDRLRHHGDVKRWLPRVTVEEIDDADLPATADEDPTAGEAPSRDDASLSAPAADEVPDEAAGADAGVTQEQTPSATTAGEAP